MVPESNRKAGPFTGTGQTQFDFDFYMLSADDVVVIVADADENETTLSKDAYTCTLNSDQNTTPGGRVTLKTALATGHKLAICSGVPYTQNLNLTMYGNFNPTSINKEEDRRVIQLQQLKERVDRTVTVPATSSESPEQLLADLFNARDSSKLSAEDAAKALQLCEEIKQNIFQYSWDIPHVVETLRDVENYPYDGLFAVKGFGNPGQHSEDISNRVVTAGGSTEPRTLSERFADVVNVRDFGAKGDGVTDDTAAIQAALDFAGGKNSVSVVFPFGVYRVSALLNIPSNCNVDGMGSIVEVDGDITLFRVAGSMGEEIPLWAEATSGDTSLTTAQPHGLSVGDMALLWSQRNALSESAGDFRLGYHQGSRCYFAEPVSIKAVTAENTVTLQKGLLFPGYRTDASQDVDTGRSTSTLSKLNFSENVAIRNMAVRHSGEGSVIRAQFVKNLLVDNVTISTSTKGVYGVSLLGCYGVRINGVSQFGDPATDVDFDTDGFWKWTAVGCSSSWYVDVENCHFGAVPNGVDFTFYGDHWCSMFCNMRNCFVVGATANGSTSHPGVYDHSFSGNTFVDCEVGLTVRGRKARVISNTLTRAKQKDWSPDDRAIILFTSAIESVVSNNVIDGYYYGIVDFAYVSNVACLQKHNNIYTGNNIKNSFVGIRFADGPENNVEKVSSVVANNVIEFDNIGILCNQWRHGAIAHGNYLRGSASKKDGATAIVIEADSTNNTFYDNVIDGARSYNITFSKTDSAYSEFVDANNNNVYGYDVKFGSEGYLNNGTYPKASKRYEKIVVSQPGASVQNGYPEGNLIAVEGVNGATVSIVSAGSNGFSTFDFLDKDLTRKASVGYGYSANRLDVGIEGVQWSFRASSFSPNTDNALSLGTASNRASTIYAGTGSINTSDERTKTNIVGVDEALMRAWGKVNFRVFQFKDAVEKKGSDARLHVGVIAQQVTEAFASEGLDATRYGLLCYDKWDRITEEVKVIDRSQSFDEEGNEIPELSHTETIVLQDAGDRYGIRYEEALALEAAYQRWQLNRIKKYVGLGD